MVLFLFWQIPLLLRVWLCFCNTFQHIFFALSYVVQRKSVLAMVPFLWEIGALKQAKGLVF